MNSVLGNLFSACIHFIHFTDLHCLDVDFFIAADHILQLTFTQYISSHDKMKTVHVYMLYLVSLCAQKLLCTCPVACHQWLRDIVWL